MAFEDLKLEKVEYKTLADGMRKLTRKGLQTYWDNTAALKKFNLQKQKEQAMAVKIFKGVTNEG